MKNIYFIIVILVILGGVYLTLNKKQVEEAPINLGKLNINEVCEGALAYMSFPDGASADKFVAECKAGDHPEVIEKYKADMGLGDGAQI